MGANLLYTGTCSDAAEPTHPPKLIPRCESTIDSFVWHTEMSSHPPLIGHIKAKGYLVQVNLPPQYRGCSSGHSPTLKAPSQRESGTQFSSSTPSWRTAPPDVAVPCQSPHGSPSHAQVYGPSGRTREFDQHTHRPHRCLTS